MNRHNPCGLLQLQAVDRLHRLQCKVTICTDIVKSGLALEYIDLDVYHRTFSIIV